MWHLDILTWSKMQGILYYTINIFWWFSLIEFNFIFFPLLQWILLKVKLLLTAKVIILHFIPLIILLFSREFCKLSAEIILQPYIKFLQYDNLILH